MKFTHLHVHSHYSLLDGLSKIGDLVDHVKKLGMDSIALTDHGVLYGAVEFYKEAKKKGIKPIIGAELYLSHEKMEQKRPNIDHKRYHVVLLVKNKEGYKNLVNLITKAHLDGFYYKPRIDEDLLEKHKEGLIVLSGCIQGKIARLIISNKHKEAKEMALKWQKTFGKDNFFLEIQHHPNIPEQKKVNDFLIDFSKESKIPIVATADSHYLKKEDAEAQDILMLINTGADINDSERLTMKNEDFSLKSPQEMTEAFKDVPEAIENTEKIKNMCDFEFELGNSRLPKFEVPNGKTEEQYLEELCCNGLKKRYKEEITNEIKQRLKYELSVIKELKFSSYFLIVQDLVNWAKSKRIVVGPGRGSAAGSLVSYVLGITNVDPIKHGLIFERFLNPGRVAGLPDIDLDFTDRRRDEVINYAAEKYGRDKVAQIITFGTMAARAVIRDVGRVLGYPYFYCDKLAKMIPFGFNLEMALKKVDEFKEIYNSDEQAKRLIDIAKKLEGVIRHASTHACGVVISPEPLTNYVPLQRPTQNEKTIVTQYEMHSVESLGLLKMDFLGLKNLTIIEDTLARIYVIRNEKIDIEKIPDDDKETYQILRNAESTGIFQLESGGMKRYLKEMAPTRFEDIEVLIALYRPGPMELIPSYIKRKNKEEEITYLHSKLKPILEKTYGIMVYQEQLMKIAQELAGFSLSEADVLRKAVGKKIKELLGAQEEKFINGCVKNNIPKKTAEKIWQWILPFASYGFNKSHSTAYAMIAYQTAYLKAHYPVEFMASLLTSEKTDTERVAILIDECKKMKIEVLPPDINESLKNFTVIPKEKKITFGLLAIKNVGEGIIDIITEERKKNGLFKSIGNFIERTSSRELNKKSFESLIKAGAFDKFAERNQLLYNLENLLAWARETAKTKTNGQIGLFGVQNLKSEITLIPSEPAKDQEKLAWEKELLGLYISSHPLDSMKEFLNKNAFSIAKIDDSLINRKVKLAGIILKIKKIITKNGKQMMFLTLEDPTGKIDVTLFPSIIENSKAAIEENKIVFVLGKIDSRNGEIQVIADEIQEIIGQ
ncbi:MAG: DNA polymerase III subunit alpha [Candidatus Paceibacterota bacterium]